MEDEATVERRRHTYDLSKPRGRQTIPDYRCRRPCKSDRRKAGRHRHCLRLALDYSLILPRLNVDDGCLQLHKDRLLPRRHSWRDRQCVRDSWKPP